MTGLVSNNIRFPGQYYDGETGLHYNYFRDYKPEVGRYVEGDPIGTDEGKNHLYAYVGNNPITKIDTYGLAYFAKRPLHSLPWMGICSCNPGSIDDIDNTEISHEQLFFEDGDNPSNIGFFDDGTLKAEPNPTGYQCKSGHYNDCIMRKAFKKVPLRTYCLLGKPGPVAKYNCQDWAGAVRKEYYKLMNGPDIKCECGK